MKPVDLICLILVVVGALNWGLVGAFDFNLVAAIFGTSLLAKLVYIAVGAAGVVLAVRVASAPRTLRLAAA